MLTISQPILSNGTYLLLSFVGFLLYVFLYLSYQGIFSGKKNQLHNRPPVTGFDSMRGGNANFSHQEQPGPESLNGAHEETSFFFDHEATFPGSQAERNTAPREDVLREGSWNESVTSPNIQEEDGGEEDGGSDWPSPGEETGTGLNDGPLEGDLTPEERQLVSRVRYSLDTDEEAYPYLDEEYREIQDRISILIGHTGKSREEVISGSLDSREKVILNAVSLGRRNSVGPMG